MSAKTGKKRLLTNEPLSVFFSLFQLLSEGLEEREIQKQWHDKQPIAETQLRLWENCQNFGRNRGHMTPCNWFACRNNSVKTRRKNKNLEINGNSVHKNKLNSRRSSNVIVIKTGKQPCVTLTIVKNLPSPVEYFFAVRWDSFQLMDLCIYVSRP